MKFYSIPWHRRRRRRNSTSHGGTKTLEYGSSQLARWTRRFKSTVSIRCSGWSFRLCRGRCLIPRNVLSSHSTLGLYGSYARGHSRCIVIHTQHQQQRWDGSIARSKSYHCCSLVDLSILGRIHLCNTSISPNPIEQSFLDSFCYTGNHYQQQHQPSTATITHGLFDFGFVYGILSIQCSRMWGMVPIFHFGIVAINWNFQSYQGLGRIQNNHYQHQQAKDQRQ